MSVHFRQFLPSEQMYSVQINRLTPSNPAIAAVVLGVLSVVWLFGIVATKLAGDVGMRLLHSPSLIIQALMLIVILTFAACLRRVFPVGSFLVAMVSTAGLTLLLDDRSMGLTPLYLFAIVTLAIRTQGMKLVLLTVLAMATDVAVTAVRGLEPTKNLGEVHTPQHLIIVQIVNVLFTYGMLVAFGLVIAKFRTYSSTSSAAIEQLRQEHEAKLNDAIASERQNMARELHDVAAHHLTGMLIQTKSANKVLASHPDDVQAMLDGAIDQGQRALDSLRQIVGILRLGEGDPDYPQPMIADIPEMIDGCRAAGSPLTFELEGSFAELDSAVQLSCYRIVQEALSNALRHAPTSPVHVNVRRDHASVVVAIDNEDGISTAAMRGQGFGIPGMRERTTLLGGEFSAGPDGIGGWTVRATMPISGRIIA
ncbi:sensor histidine kinase [Rhodococcus sp. OK302]|uniref:sensor histidine kinase n=1 Tax=Rhodococcus sp. OK302 TaxID=1882769 RepID=UPI0015958C61|nr:histidine kinase [Rhodococcus sp. OK302]